ncbi:hypothetical protein PIB30_088386 [Stylosanthes scabra]|uniref:Uncharacterized protein n=1 Tax=Stylosanthes scabra TaxID=79078 RepID=A0ABU6XT24_9FABA|nr:hypothetical protein [Stylosanthes scabra]
MPHPRDIHTNILAQCRIQCRGTALFLVTLPLPTALGCCVTEKLMLSKDASSAMDEGRLRTSKEWMRLMVTTNNYISFGVPASRPYGESSADNKRRVSMMLKVDTNLFRKPACDK